MSLRPSNPTIKDVARESGVSIKTVSRVLNNESGVREDTAERVRKAASELGYSVNLAARQLVSGRTGSIGILVFASTHWQWTADLVSGALMAGRAQGYGLAPFVLENYESAEREAVLWLASRHAVDGVILTTPWNENQQLHRELRERGMPFVLLPAPPESDEAGVRSKDAEGAAVLTRHLLDLGHRRIALLGGQPGIDLTRIKVAGFEAELRRAGIDPAGVPRVLADYSFETGLRCARELLASRPRPSAIFCLSDLLGAAAVRAACEAGLRVPQDVSIVGMGDQMAGRIVWPPLTTVAIPTEQMAGRAAELLIEHIRNGKNELGQVVFDTELIVRESSGPGPDDVARVEAQ